MGTQASATLAALYQMAASESYAHPFRVSELVGVLDALATRGGRASARQVALRLEMSAASALGAAYELADLGLAEISSEGDGLTASVELSITPLGEELARESRGHRERRNT